MHPSTPKSEYLEWVEDFYGNNMTFDHYEMLMISHVPAKDRKKETELMNTKWHDYRLMHPMYATYYFYHLYVKAYQAFWAKTINHEAAPFIYPFKGEAKRNFLKAREGLSIWRMRQNADLLGIRYEFFLTAAFNRMYRTIASGRVVPPRPSMLNKEDLLAQIHLDWVAMCEASLQISCSPYFRVVNFNNSLIQRDHERFVMGQIANRRVSYYSLAYCLHDTEVVSIESALQFFDVQTVQMAINESNNY